MEAPAWSQHFRLGHVEFYDQLISNKNLQEKYTKINTNTFSAQANPNQFWYIK